MSVRLSVYLRVDLKKILHRELEQDSRPRNEIPCLCHAEQHVGLEEAGNSGGENTPASTHVQTVSDQHE